MLLDRRFWIFDLDGTLTRAAHDFDAIRAELGLPAGQPILEALDRLPPHRAAALHQRLDTIEQDIAVRAQPADGASELLATLAGRSIRRGIVTRNGAQTARLTLQAAGLAAHFEQRHVVGREAARPKPSPEGIGRLLDDWGGAPDQAVMVGDHLFDLLAGRAAGTWVVYVDPSGRFPYRHDADVVVRRLDELL